MKLDGSSTALVIVGGWNRFIFTPDWIKRFLFPEESDGVTVERHAEPRPKIVGTVCVATNIIQGG